MRAYAALPTDAQISFYRTAARTELDLVVEHRARKIGVEIKFSATPKPTKSFWLDLQDLQIDRAYVVASELRCYPLAQGVDVLPVREVGRIVADLAR